jgi:hypothetical protein
MAIARREREPGGALKFSSRFASPRAPARPLNVGAANRCHWPGVSRSPFPCRGNSGTWPRRRDWGDWEIDAGRTPRSDFPHETGANIFSFGGSPKRTGAKTRRRAGWRLSSSGSPAGIRPGDGLLRRFFRKRGRRCNNPPGTLAQRPAARFFANVTGTSRSRVRQVNSRATCPADGGG